jgi:hypothetical protein
MKTIFATVVALSLAVNAYMAIQYWTGSGATRSGNSTVEMLVMRSPGGLLEVSTITAEERFDSTTNHTVLGVSLGRTVAQIRVPTVYRYHIPLAKDWNIRLSGNTLIVVAPAVQPSLPVAIDTGKLESFSSGLWSPITGAEAVTSLQKSITARLGDKAASPPLILLQREAARQTVEEFVRKWVVGQTRWHETKPPALFVFFEDEPLGQRAAPLLSEAL